MERGGAQAVPSMGHAERCFRVKPICGKADNANETKPIIIIIKYKYILKYTHIYIYTDNMPCIYKYA